MVFSKEPDGFKCHEYRGYKKRHNDQLVHKNIADLANDQKTAAQRNSNTLRCVRTRSWSPLRSPTSALGPPRTCKQHAETVPRNRHKIRPKVRLKNARWSPRRAIRMPVNTNTSCENQICVPRQIFLCTELVYQFVYQLVYQFVYRDKDLCVPICVP